MNRVPEEIETERLRLRLPTESDAELVFGSYATDSEVSRYLAWRPHRSISDSKLYIKERIRMWESGERYTWSIELKDCDSFIGMLTFRWPVHFRTSISFVLGRIYWNRGYASELTQKIVSWSLTQKGIYRIEAFCDVENTRSIRALEKSGMAREALIKRVGYSPNISQEPRNCWCYSKVK